MSPEHRSIALVVLVSGGTKLPPIWEYTQNNPRAHIHLVVSNKENPKYYPFIKEKGVPAISVRWLKDSGESREEYSERLGNLINEHLGGLVADPASYLIFSAGQPYVLSKDFIDKFNPDRLINLHPGLLPDIPTEDWVLLSTGEKVPALRGMYDHGLISEVLKRKFKWTGATVHYLTQQVDSGLVISRREVPVVEGDTVQSLADRVHTQEDFLIPNALDLILNK